MSPARTFVVCACLSFLVSSPTLAQHDMTHAAPAGAASPTLPGQAAFGAISEIVRILEADPTTDWSKVNVEALRLHLIDMDDVMMHSSVQQRAILGGAAIDVTGKGATVAAIKRIVTNQSRMLDHSDAYAASVEELPNGARMKVTAKQTTDSATTKRIRGLGFAGLFTEGDHHTRHHLALARGDADPHGH